MEPRRQDRLPILLNVEFPGQKDDLPATTLNVSRGGMFVQTKTPLPVQSRVFFRIEVPPKRLHFHLEAEVVWSRKGRRSKSSSDPSGMGIRFLLSRAQSEQALENIFSVLHQQAS